MLIIFQGLQPPPKQTTEEKENNSKIKERYNTFLANITSRKFHQTFTQEKEKPASIMRHILERAKALQRSLRNTLALIENGQKQGKETRVNEPQPS